MKLTSPTIAALAVAALGPTACTIEVSPALPSAGDNASAPAGDTSTAEVNRTSETTKEETPGIPSGLPTLTGADGSAIPYQMALSTADAPSSDLATEVVAELTPHPVQVDGAVDCDGYATILENTADGAHAYWPMSWDGTNPVRLDGFVPGAPGIDVQPGLIAGGSSPALYPDWTFGVSGDGTTPVALTSEEYTSMVVEGVELGTEDLWAFLVGDGGSSLFRFPLDGAASEAYGVWDSLGDATFGVLALATDWSHPDISGFEIHHLGRGLDSTVVRGSFFDGRVGEMATDGDATAVALTLGANYDPFLVVVDQGAATVVDLSTEVTSLTVSGRYVTWSEATHTGNVATGQCVLDLESGLITALGVGAMTSTLPAMCGSTIAWTVAGANSTDVVTATLP